MLDERKVRILQAITDDYIMTAEPVGSRTVARRYDLGVSPATIRNEMADLEELGYLEQPHTSAGRIPTDRGYRYYVDALMKPEPVSREARSRVRREVQNRSHAMEELIFRATRLLAELSHYTAVVAAPRLSEAEVHHLQLVPMGRRRILLVLVVRPGFIFHRSVDLKTSISPSEVQYLSDFLNGRLHGVTLKRLGSRLSNELRDEISDSTVAEATINLLEEALRDDQQDSAYLDGVLNVLNQPEFRDIEKARSLLSFLDDREVLADILAEYGQSDGVKVTIGTEHSYVEMQSCSMVSSAYYIGSTKVGTLGVLGPTRMDYRRVVSLVEFVADSLSSMLTRAAKA